jgi:DNA repair exonuclease SbcCD ATPase subunit
MIRLRKLTISGFRGARFALPLDFGARLRSVAVYGENAAGKSTIADALEWFIYNRVDHLWREDCKEDALRNVFAGANDESQVSVEFSNSWTNTKSLDSELRLSDANHDDTFGALILDLRNENIFLRHAQIAEFIQKSKTEKRKAVASIIGYDTITDFRNVIQSTCNGLQREPEYTSAKYRADHEKKKLLRLTGRIIASPSMLYEQMNTDLKGAGFDLLIKDKASYQFAITKLRATTNQEQRVKEKLLLDDLARSSGELANVLLALVSGGREIEEYNHLVETRSAVGQINLHEFLRLGSGLIEHGHVSGAECPFCLTAYDLTQLRDEVYSRIEAISHVKARLGAVSSSVDRLIATISQARSLCERFATRFQTVTAHEELREHVERLLPILLDLLETTSSRFKQHEVISLPEAIRTELNNFQLIARKHVELAAKASQSLSLTEYETRIVSLLERLSELRLTFYNYNKDTKIVAAFERQILTLGKIFDQFVQVQNSALQNVLDKISENVGSFYRAIHPDENIDKVRLRVVGEEGVEFEYFFHGQPAHPPMKYLSESHLNSLGVVLFLASAKLFNRKSRFLVLDDIVTSFDHSHRRRLLRLIREKFSDWQIVLLTHEAFWFDMIKKELVPQGWLVHEVVSDDENGIQIEPSAKDIGSLIDLKRQRFDVSNDLRKLLEATLKEICLNLEVKMAFRFNDQNERRMNGELLNELRSTINRKCASLKDHRIFSNLEGSNLVITIGSHDNPEAIAGGDIDVALADIAMLRELFECKSCNRYVSATFAIAGHQTITCKCGQTKLDWR